MNGNHSRRDRDGNLWVGTRNGGLNRLAGNRFSVLNSHELRTPMNGIIGMADLALGTALSAEQREYLEMLKLSADSLLTAINDVLHFSKIEANKLELQPVPFRLAPQVHEMLAAFAFQVREKRLQLVCRVEPDVPDEVIGDPDRLRQVLTNLVGNAIKFTREGEIVVTVEAGPGNTEGIELHFSVRDTGLGIAKDKLGAIFEPFVQADGSTTRTVVQGRASAPLSRSRTSVLLSTRRLTR